MKFTGIFKRFWWMFTVFAYIAFYVVVSVRGMYNALFIPRRIGQPFHDAHFDNMGSEGRACACTQEVDG